MFGWFRKYIRKIGLFGVEVEFHPPTDPAAPDMPPKPAELPAPVSRASQRMVNPQAVSRLTTAPNSPGVPLARPDVTTAREAFLTEVGRISGAAIRNEYAVVLDGLIRWSSQQGDAVVFIPHTGPQALVKFCLPGMDTHIWSAWPRKADGAKLHVLTDPHPRFPEPLREVARRELARLDGRVPKPGELPVVSFRNLRTPAAQRDLGALLSRLLAEFQRHAEPDSVVGLQ